MAYVLLLTLLLRGGAAKRPGRLVVHVGPHKTASTYMQHFLVEERLWLSDNFNIHVAAGRSPKEGAILGNTLLKRRDGPYQKSLVNESVATETVSDIQKALDANGTVIVSAEVFEHATQEVLQDLIDLVSAARTTFVHVHRDVVDRWRSYWEQLEKSSSNPSTFFEYLTRPVVGDRFSSLPSAVELVDTLAAVEAANPRGEVGVVVLEMEDQHAPLICQAALRLTGTALAACRTRVAAQLSRFDKDYTPPGRRKLKAENASPPPTAIDTVRLARHLAMITGCKAPTLKATSNSVQAVAERLPSTCDGILNKSSSDTPLGELAAALDRTWLARAGSNAPLVRAAKPMLCFVDERKLELPHWSAIKTLLLGCPRPDK